MASCCAAAAPLSARSSSSSCVDNQEGTAIGGRLIQPVYALASDETAQRDLAAGIQSDTKAISEWWRREDPDRAPRFSLGPPCGPVLVRVVRLPDSLETLRGDVQRGSRISDAVVLAGSGSPFVKYLVYYFGSVDGSVCGRGGGAEDGQAVAIVFASACPGVPRVTIAAHELLHALGAVARSGPPHLCGWSRDHVCDSRRDVLYPYASLVGLDDLFLDYRRDDYYGHGEAWLDVRNSRWLRHLDDPVSLTVTVIGEGLVRSDVPGVACRTRCVVEWDSGTVFNLTASPATGQFGGWGGKCAGVSHCALELRKSATVTARFVP